MSQKCLLRFTTIYVIAPNNRRSFFPCFWFRLSQLVEIPIQSSETYLPQPPPALSQLLDFCLRRNLLFCRCPKAKSFHGDYCKRADGSFLITDGFRSMPVAVQLGRGLGATHGRWSCDRGGKERTRCATSEVYTRKLSKLLKKKQNSQKAF